MRTYERGMQILYTNLRSVMAAKGVTIETMAKYLGVHRNTVAQKLNGESEFSFSQAEQLQEGLFPEYAARYLFHRDTEAKD